MGKDIYFVQLRSSPLHLSLAFFLPETVTVLKFVEQVASGSPAE
jgi:hypothetical protein